MLQTFDAPNGDFSCVRRLRSNTPLQALVSLNEPQFVECAQALARKTLAEGGKTDVERMKTVLHVTAQAVSDCRTLLSPFLPHSAQAVHEALGGTGTVSPLPEIREVEDLDGGPGYPVLMGDYRLGETMAAWRSEPIVPGTPIPAPSPIFRKLDESVIAEELARLSGEGEPE
jgi:methionyl-tRNA synthetase